MERVQGSNALNPIVSGSLLLCLCFSSTSTGARECGSNHCCCCLACFDIFVALFISSFPCFPSPPAICRYLPLLPTVLSVQKLAVYLISTLVVCFAAVLDFLHRIIQSPWCFLFKFSLFLMLWSRSFCCAVVSSTAAVNLPCVG